jgi:hypothetical protein
MTDIFFNAKKHSDHQKFLKGMELLYFGYRDFISWPDDVLQTYGFGPPITGYCILSAVIRA